MDKVKQAGEFLWKHRFWFSLGLAVFVVLMVTVLESGGAQQLKVKAGQRQKQLDDAFKGVQAFTNGSEHPNPDAITAAEAEVSKLDGSVNQVWEDIYKAQMPLMTWPDNVKELFSKRPFGADLSDQSNRFLVQYQRIFPFQVVDLFYELDPIEKNEADEVVGTIEADPAVIHSAAWTRTPLSMEAWQAQEELWIQRAIVKAIRKANTGAKDWHSAAVRRLMAIGIGGQGLDAKTVSSAAPLLDAQGAAAGAPAVGAEGALPAAAPVAGGDQGITAQRYLTKTTQYRIVPVYVSMLVDQPKIPAVLACLADADFNFTIHQVEITVPTEPVTLPVVLQESSTIGQGGARDDSIFNSLQLDVWGQMRIYETPPSMMPPPPGAPGEPGAPAAPAAPADQGPAGE